MNGRNVLQEIANYYQVRLVTGEVVKLPRFARQQQVIDLLRNANPGLEVYRHPAGWADIYKPKKLDWRQL